MKLKKLLAVLLSAALCVSMAACGGTAASKSESAAPAESEAVSESQAEAEPTAAPETSAEQFSLRIGCLKGPTTMGLVNLIAASEAGETAGDYQFTISGAADELVPLLVKGDLDAAAIPANLAATLFQKTEGALQVLCINTLGVLYVVENGETVQSIADLAGQTIVTTGKGTTPEYVLRYLLSENGIDPDKDVTIEFASEATEALAQVQAGTANIAMLPQPFVTAALAQVEGLRVALDMNAEWEAVTGRKLVTGVTVIRRDVAEAIPGGVRTFLDEYAASVETANTDPETTAALCEQYGIVAKAALAQKALPRCNIVFEDGEELWSDLNNYLTVLYDADPASVGGQLPGDEFYYDPYAVD